MFSEITFSKVKAEIQAYLQSTYNKAGVLFTPASPYGQILSVIENLFQLSILYLKNVIKNVSLLDKTSINERMIKNSAILAGHLPTRAISASGTLKLSLNSTTVIQNDISGGKITLYNKQTLKNKTNGLYYSVNLGVDKQLYNINNSSTIYIQLVQGRWSKTTFTGDGTISQSFTVTLRGVQEVENFNYEVLVNGTIWETKTAITDLLPNENSCVLRSGIDGGIDILFGNSDFGGIPPLSSTIEVYYISSDGQNGNIFRRTQNDWIFVDSATDGLGNSIDLTKYFNVDIYTDINFGANAEDILFTKSIVPVSSNNFVVGTVQQFAYQIKKLGVFSHVNAYLKNGVVYIIAVPNINLFKNSNSSYFNISLSAFMLDNYEKSKIIKYLQSGGNILLSQKLVIDTPVLSLYVINVFIITYSDSVMDNVNSEIINALSTYFLSLSSTDAINGRIPVSTIISILSAINDINSVNISFVSKKNEDYHSAAIIADQNRRNQYADPTLLSVSRPSLMYNPNTTLGLDHSLGDILFEPNEVPVIRGGWYDRNTNYYSDDINSNVLKTVNIVNIGTVQRN
jgi:hypothetical protein